MVRLIPLLSAALLAAILLPAPARAQATLHGIVRDDSTARPIAGVEVLVSGTTRSATTNAAGRYEVAGVPAGQYEVVFRMVGYLPARVPVVLAAGESLRVNQVLSPSAVVLEPVVVTGEAMRSVGLAGTGFDERRRMGFGRFITPEELRESEHLRVTDVLRRHRVEVHPIPIVPNSQVYRWVAMHPYRRDASGRLNCPMVTYVDGVLTAIEDLRTNLDVSALTAVEVYRGAAQVPVLFGGTQAQCGVIAFWTRRGSDP